MELFKLFGSILVDNEAANKSISKTDETANKSSNSISKAFTTVGKSAVAIGTAFVGAGTAMYAMASKAAATADNVDKMSQRLGLSRQAYQELDYVLSQSGVSIDSFQSGMKSLLKNMDAVTEGNATAISNFEMLGIAVQNSDGSLRSQEEVLYDSIKAFQGMESSAEKSRLAQELFGKQGQELLPLLNSEAGSMEELIAQANDFGLVLGDDVIDAGVDFTDMMDTLTRTFQTVATKIGTAVMPIITKLVNYIMDNMPTIQKVIGTVFSVFEKFVQGVVTVVSWLIDELTSYLSALGFTWSDVFNAIGVIANTVFALVTDYWNTILKPGLEMIRAYITNVLLPFWSAVFNAIWPIVQYCFTKIIELWNKSLKPILVGIIDFLTGVFTGNWQKIFSGLLSILSGLWSGIKTVLWTPFEIFINAISGIGERILAPFRQVLNSIGGIWSSIKSVFKLPHFSISGSFNPIDWLSGGLPKIGVEWYAKAMDGGMILDEPTIFGAANGKLLGAGEAGSETVVGTGSLMSMIQNAVDNASGKINAQILSVLIEIKDFIIDEDKRKQFLIEILEKLESNIVLDDRELGRMIKKYVG